MYRLVQQHARAINSDELARLPVLPAFRIDTIGRFGRHALLRFVPKAARPPMADEAPAPAAAPARVPGGAR